jgi:hypothetical protein
MDKPLTAFTPLVKKASIGLSEKALSFYFSFAYYLALRGMVSPGTPLLLFLLGWPTFLRAGGADSVKPER